MILMVFGISHHTANVLIRERWVINDEKTARILSFVKDKESFVQELCILSTCNRTEFYAVVAEPELLITSLMSILGLNNQDLALAYNYNDMSAVEHLLKVASGLDSMIFGEHEIIAQLKQALNMATQNKTIGPCLNKLWQTAFATSKKIRHQTGLNRYSISLPAIALKLAKNIFADFSKLTVLLIGSGDIIKVMGKYLIEQNITRFFLCNRTKENIDALVEYWQLDANIIIDKGDLTKIPSFLPDSNIIITAVNNKKHLLTKKILTRFATNKTMYIVDLAVPRNIEVSAGELENIYLYTIDDLAHIVDNNKTAKERVTSQAAEIIQEFANKFIIWWHDQDGRNNINNYRLHCYTVRDQLLNKARQDLLRGKDAFLVIEKLAYQLTNKLTHIPTKSMQNLNKVTS